MISSSNTSKISVANSEQQLDGSELLTDIEKHKLLVEWNNTTSDYPQDKCIHELFEATVELTPEAIAVVFEGEQLTYRELNARANQVAHYLQALGVGPEALVGICVERSLEMIVGLLGILKAGGAYVPLDRSYPPERLAFMLEDSCVQVLLTQQQLVESLPLHQAHIVCLDTDWEIITRQSEENPASGVMPDNLTYVIYTSGSTGKPKGVAMSHRPLLNLIEWQLQNSTLPDGAKTLQFSPISFDVSFQEIFSTWCAGGTLVLISDEVRRDAVQLLHFLKVEAIARLFLPFVALQQLAEVADGQEAVPTSLREVITAGEQLQITRQIANWFTKLNNCTLHNQYGPSESHVVTAFTLTGSPSDWPALPPIGRPINNTQIYLLDDQLQPVPSGVSGELYIGGIALARGYLNRPDLTEERFIPNPFSHKPDVSSFGAAPEELAGRDSALRLYKTGDNARYLADGNIEYLGRIDEQVKIRGYRIELGEIEAALWQHPDVRSVAVTVREDVPGNKRLVAYVVPNQEAAPTVNDLRRFLKEKLPDYMVPDRFVFLKTLPLTPSGKVNRKALPAPDTTRRDAEADFVPPSNPVEEVLAGIWVEVLGIESVGVHDNFLELGGHSLLATQVISRVRQAFQVELPLRSLFDAPTVAELAKRIEEGYWEKQGLQAPPIQPVSRNQNLPLSWGQEQLWFLAQLEPDTPVYNEPCTIRFTGAINVDALSKALNEIIKRHESLRTRFITVDGQPVCAIAPPDTFNLTVVDLRVFPQELREAEALQIATKEAKLLFDLTTNPLLRATLMRLADFDYRLILTFHHIIIDGVSLYSVFLKELAALYEAFSTGRPSPLAPLPVQYADFAVWQRQWLTQEILESQLDYWKQQLADLPVLQLPYDHPRPKKGTFRGAKQCLVLSFDLTQALKTLSQQEGVTLYMTLLAAFKTLLYRYTGQDDIVVGTMSANRNRPELEWLIGYFLNTLVLRTDMSGTPSFRELLKRVRQVTLGAYAHEDLPFEKLVQTLQPERNLSQNPLFQVAFAPQPPMPSLNGDWTINQLDIQTDTAKFDLLLDVEERPESIIGRLEYNTDLFDANTISRMIGHFQTLLEGIVTNREQRVSELPLLTEQEQHQLLFEWNNTTKEYPQDKCIHQLFEEQVERSPDAVAVVFEGEQLTYLQLNAKANQLAHHLQSLGVEPDVPVGICVERSIEMVVGILGILKAGGAYVPLDRSYPEERIAFMLENAQVRVLLTQRQLIESLPLHQASLICLDTDWQVIARQSEENPAIGVTPDNLAYVIYTSGSTGKPKGVTMSHHSLSNLIQWQVENSTASIGTKTLQFSPISFDVSFQEIFSTWCAGGTLVLILEEIRRDPVQLLRFLASEEIARLFLPFVALQQLAEVADGHEAVPTSLREVITAGEQLKITRQIANWFTKLKNCTLHNQYGPSESHVVTAFTLTDSPSYWPALPPIGRPIANTQIHILDAQLQPVPIGVPGELYIGGIALALCYLNRPDLTDQRFIPNPFTNKPGERLYKTGDKARYLPDGNIEFLGRIDYQVKIRGFRIELGEVEAMLAQHPQVQEAVVICREDIPGNKYLAAYVVPKVEALSSASSPTISELRSFLKAKLPDYMVPGAFVFLEAMPLTPNGKVDRRALPAPDSSRRELEDKFVAPSTPTEEIVAAIWAEVLGLQQVGINDNFFELGGHSLLATQIISRIREAFKIELPLRHLFEAPTIASLDHSIETAQLAGTQEPSSGNVALDTLPPFVPAARDIHIPLSFAQQAIWYFQQLYPDSCTYNIPITLRFTGALSPKVLEKSINEIIRRHEILRTTFPIKEEQPVQVIAQSLTLPLKIVDLQDLPKEEREASAIRLAAQEAQHHFDLACGPLIKTTLLRLAPQEHWLLITMHHIITDGWSYGILLQELGTLYNAFSNGLPSPLPELPFQYVDFTVWEQKWLNEEVLAHQLSYWQRKLADLPTSLDLLPAKQPRNSNNSRRASFYSLILPSSLVASINALSRSQGITTFVIILTALKILLFNWSRETDIIVVATTANRSTPAIENMMGCFINDVILRTQLDSFKTGVTLLEKVNQTVREAIAHQEIPLEKVVETVSEPEFLRTVSVSMVPPIRWQEQILGCEVVSVPLECELWDEKNIPLELYISSQGEDSQTIEIQGVYSTDLFTHETIERLFSSYQEILQKLVEHPETKLSEFEWAKDN
jgi:amino acid adenylation domain-containing protein